MVKNECTSPACSCLRDFSPGQALNPIFPECQPAALPSIAVLAHWGQGWRCLGRSAVLQGRITAVLCSGCLAASLDNVVLRDNSEEKLLVKISNQGTSCGLSRMSSCFLSRCKAEPCREHIPETLQAEFEAHRPQPCFAWPNPTYARGFIKLSWCSLGNASFALVLG